MILFRSILFKIAFPLWTAFSCIVFSPFLILPVSSKTAGLAGKFWAAGTVVLLRVICNIRYEIRGRKHLPKKGAFILACKHQSVWDTAIFLREFDHACYILKKELLSVPLFGRFLVAIDMIPIDRSAGASALKKMLKETKKRLDEGRQVVIFPEGTRTMPGEKHKYQPGIAYLYKDPEITAPIIPAVLNSGKFWNKNLIKNPGTIILEFLPPIEKGIESKEFMKTLQETIETAYEKIA